MAIQAQPGDLVKMVKPHTHTHTHSHPQNYVLQPPEEIADRMREIDALATAGEKWAKQDKHPWELFTICLHNTFLAVLRARKMREDEMGALFCAKNRRTPRDLCPRHQLQLPQQPAGRAAPPVLRQLPREWTWGTDLLPVTLEWISELRWLDKPPPADRKPRAQ